MNGILSDLDDFLAPSLECIKMVPDPKGKQMKPGGSDTAQTKVTIGNDFEFEEEVKVEMASKQKGKKEEKE